MLGLFVLAGDEVISVRLHARVLMEQVAVVVAVVLVRSYILAPLFSCPRSLALSPPSAVTRDHYEEKIINLSPTRRQEISNIRLHLLISFASYQFFMSDFFFLTFRRQQNRGAARRARHTENFALPSRGN